MAGSIAEERIRARVEERLRSEFPEARIVHELNMVWGGIRLDLGAVRPNAITLVEIKSERDVLKRLASQTEAALAITGDVRVYAAEKHRAALKDYLSPYIRGADGRHEMVWTKTARGEQGRYTPNPNHIGHLNRALIMIETEDGFDPLEPMHSSWWPRRWMDHMADPRAILEMLWAGELRQVPGSQPRDNRRVMQRRALESLTGEQIRRLACSALRSRPFARADAEAA